MCLGVAYGSKLLEDWKRDDGKVQPSGSVTDTLMRRRGIVMLGAVRLLIQQGGAAMMEDTVNTSQDVLNGAFSMAVYL